MKRTEYFIGTCSNPIQIEAVIIKLKGMRDEKIKMSNIHSIENEYINIVPFGQNGDRQYVLLTLTYFLKDEA